MKTRFFISFFLLTFLHNSFSQTSNELNRLTEDEIARVKFSVHLMNYQNPPSFDNALGDALYNIVKSSFTENLSIPELTTDGITAHDQTIINGYIELLKGAAKNPLSWNQLFQLETQYLIWWDRANHKVSRYTN
jgi:hypothetical protein